MRIILTRDLAAAAAWDAANRAMRNGGRTAWNRNDANVNAREFARLWPICRDLGQPAPDVCPHCREARHDA